MDQRIKSLFSLNKNKIKKRARPLLAFFLALLLLFADSFFPLQASELAYDCEEADNGDLPEIVSANPSDYEDSKLILSFKQEISSARIEELLSMLPGFSLLSFDQDMALLKSSSSTSLAKALTLLSTMEDIALVQPNYPYSQAGTDEAFPLSLPNDTYFDKQWGLYNDGGSSISAASQREAQAGIDINVLDAWNYFQSSREVVVALIDTGVDYKHPDLKDHIYINQKEWKGKKGVDDDGDGFIDDIYGWDFYNNDASVCHYNSAGKALAKEDDNHGTHCAGIIAAARDNNAGISGVASNVDVKLLPVKALGGPDGVSDSYTLACAVRYAAQRGAKICNASWTTRDNDPVLETAILESNMLFVCAAGNDSSQGGSDLDRQSYYPASFRLPNTIAVSAIDSDGKLSHYANYGTGTVALAAPGTRIVSSIVGSYAYMSGTSMAAPFVTGVAAMIYAKKSSLSPADMVKILSNSVTPLESLEGKVGSGGIINARKALDLTDSYVPAVDKLAPSISVKIDPYRNYAIVQPSVKDRGSSYLLLSRYASGRKSASWFKKGKNGNAFGKNLTLKTSGYYTFYALDSAGNKRIKTVKVTFDKKAPTAVFQVQKKKKIYQIKIKVRDSQSGVKQIRLLGGKRKISAFKNGKSGRKIAFSSSTSTALLTLQKKGIYSFYLMDKAGNAIVKVLKIKN